MFGHSPVTCQPSPFDDLWSIFHSDPFGQTTQIGARLPRLALHTLLLALPFAAILAEPALAQNLDPLENMLQVVVDGLTGPIGRLIAILAVVAAGYMMFTGRLNWPLFLAIFFGVVLVFSTATIIDGFAAP